MICEPDGDLVDELSEYLELAPSTAYRHLVTLCEHNYMVREDGIYDVSHRGRHHLATIITYLMIKEKVNTLAGKRRNEGNLSRKRTVNASTFIRKSVRVRFNPRPHQQMRRSSLDCGGESDTGKHAVRACRRERRTARTGRGERKYNHIPREVRRSVRTYLRARIRV